MEMSKEQDMRNQQPGNMNMQTGTPPPYSMNHPPDVDPYRIGYNQPTDGYVASPNNVVVVQPNSSPVLLMEQRPSDLTIWSILACLCCFWPAGIVAIYFAFEANSAADRYDMVRAHRMNKNARISIIASVVIWVLAIVVMGIVVSVYLSKLSNESVSDFTNNMNTGY